MSRDFDITDFGAVPGGGMNTKPVQAAIDAAADAGGGTVSVPAGEFVTGTIRLRSHIRLLLGPGAVLRGSGDMADYPPQSFGRFRNTPTLIFAVEESDIRICGEGRIDLNDRAFMDWDRLKVAPEKELGVPMDDARRAEAVVEHLDRPDQPILFHDCTGVRIDGVTLLNAPAWFVSLSACREVLISGVRILGNLRVPNNDGIHLSACSDVVISNCIMRCGDDCVAVTCIRNPGGISERIVISNCIMTSRSAALRIGHAGAHVRQVMASNLVITDSNRGIGIFAGDGGRVEDISMSGAYMEVRQVAGAWWGNGEPLVISAADSPGARIERVRVCNMQARADNGILLIGECGNVSDIELADWDLQLSSGKNRGLFRPVLDLAPAAMRPAPDPARSIPWLIARDARDVRLRSVRYGRASCETADFSVDSLIQDVHGLRQADVGRR